VPLVESTDALLVVFAQSPETVKLTKIRILLPGSRGTAGRFVQVIWPDGPESF